MKKIILFTLLLMNCVSFSQNYTVTEKVVADQLIGDLYDSSNKETIVLLIAGSGPTNRNGNSVGSAVNNSLKYLAQGLAENNYDVFTYDKRVVYIINNKKEINSLGFQHGIDDAITVVNYLKNNLGYKNVIIAGHSEGSLVGMVAAKNNAQAFISLAGAGRPIDEILAEQVNKQAPMLNEANVKILKELKAGNIVKDVHPFLKSLYAEHNQPFLIEWMKFNPQEEIKSLNIPTLIINGTKDLQVPVSDAELLYKSNPKNKLIIIENMNHIFKEIIIDSENSKSYTNPKLPVQKELVSSIVNFLNDQKL